LLGLVARGRRSGLLHSLACRLSRKKFLAAIIVVASSPAPSAGLRAIAGFAVVARRLLRRAAVGLGEASAFIRGLFGPRSVGLLAGPGVAWFHGAKTVA